MREMLDERGAGHVRIYGGGGGVIVPREIEELHARGIDRIFSPEDGRRLGLQGMINEVVEGCDFDPSRHRASRRAAQRSLPGPGPRDHRDRAERAPARREDRRPAALPEPLGGCSPPRPTSERRAEVPVVGLTGTGGAGKSSLTDELVRRFVDDFPDKRVAVVCVDPTKRRTGGALLGDRIRFNTGQERPRSTCARSPPAGTGARSPEEVGEVLELLKGAGFDLILLETAGIGQGDSAIVDLARPLPLRHDRRVRRAVPAREDRDARLRRLRGDQQVHPPRLRGRPARRAQAAPAQPRAVRRPASRSCRSSAPAPPTSTTPASTPSTPTWWRPSPSASISTGRAATPPAPSGSPTPPSTSSPPAASATWRRSPTPAAAYRAWAREQADAAADLDALRRSIRLLGGDLPEAWRAFTEAESKVREAAAAVADLMEAFDRQLDRLDARVLGADPHLAGVGGALPGRRLQLPGARKRDRGRELPHHPLGHEGPEGRPAALPGLGRPDLLAPDRERPRRVPVHRRASSPSSAPQEDPTRMFAGEGPAARTNKRFHFWPTASPPSACPPPSTRSPSTARTRTTARTSTARSARAACRSSPSRRPSGSTPASTSADPTTSVSMTINGPAPTILAFFFNAAVRQQCRRFLRDEGRLDDLRGAGLPARPACAAPPGTTSARCSTDEEYEAVAARTLPTVRGTVQADILKEDQGQNTCIFSTEFALRLMGDVQQYFIDHERTQLLLGLDQRVPHRRGGSEPDPPARLHPGQRLHLRRVLPLARHGRSTSSRPTCRSSSRTAWTPSTR